MNQSGPSIAKSNAAPAKSALAIITPKMQKIFLTLLVFNWVGTLLVPVLSMVTSSVRLNSDFYAYIGLQSFAPLFFALLAIPFVWRHYSGALHRWFMVGFLGLVATITYGAVAQIETFIRYRWFTPVQYTTAPSFWESYKDNITLLSLSLAAYVAFFWWWDTKLSRKK